MKRYTFFYSDKKGVCKEVDVEAKTKNWAERILRQNDSVKHISKVICWPYDEIFLVPPDLSE